jgi:transcriptional regulator with XRE-family HTH domain
VATPVTPEELAEARRVLGRQLAARREAAGLTQARLAKLTGYTRSSIANLETGRSSQPRTSWTRYDQLLGAGGALLASHDDYAALTTRHRQRAAEERERQRTAKIEQWQPTVPVTAPPRPDDDGSSLHRQSDRRGFLAEGTRLAGVALSEHLVHLFTSEAHEMHRALDTGSSSEALAYYESTADHVMIHYERHGPVELLAPALELFHEIRRLVEQPQPLAARRRLTRTASKLATLLGIFAYDNAWRAQSWFGVAQRAAVEAGDRTLLGWAIAAESLADYYGGREPAALRSLLGARRLVDDGVVAAVVAARLARAHAATGEEQPALAALDAAEHYLDTSSEEQRELYGFAAPQLAFYRTTCLLRLGEPDQVEAAAAEALRLYAGTPHYMDPTLIRLESAAAHLIRQPPALEQAAGAARDALEALPAVHRTGPVRQRTAEITTVLHGHPDVPAAREFVEYMAEL